MTNTEKYTRFHNMAHKRTTPMTRTKPKNTHIVDKIQPPTENGMHMLVDV